MPILVRDMSFAVVALFLAAGVIFLLGNGGVQLRRRPPAPELAAEWAKLLERQSLGMRVEVVNVYQRSRAGAKAWVKHNDGRLQDAWFDGDTRPFNGDTYILSKVRTGWANNGRPNVLYVGKDSIIARARSGACRAWSRAQLTQQEP
jgi:hypothetical protein